MDDPIVTTLRAAGCVFAEDEARLLVTAAGSPAELDCMVRQRVRGLPLEQIIGWADFCGLRVMVTPGVFVPRRRTELLVREAAALLGSHAASNLGSADHATVVDLGCGTGAVGAALRALRPELDLHATDIDPAAVACAEHNLGPIVHLGDLYAPLPARLRGQVDVIVANTPYVPTDAIALMPPEARLHEHRVALDGGDDGLDVLRRVVAGAPRWLAPRGHLLIETGREQAAAALAVFREAGLAARVTHDDELDATVVIGHSG